MLNLKQALKNNLVYKQRLINKIIKMNLIQHLLTKNKIKKMKKQNKLIIQIQLKNLKLFKMLYRTMIRKNEINKLIYQILT